MTRVGSDVLATESERRSLQCGEKLVPEAQYHEVARRPSRCDRRWEGNLGPIAVLCAGTSDLPVAEEAATTAEVMGVEVDSVYDVGVAGLHRLLAQSDVLARARR